VDTAAAAVTTAPTASERVLAAELEARGDAHDALSMMVSSVVRMVQAGKTRDSRWKAS
jgi:glyoxylate carboligase